jgi:hypothetical protein
VDRWVDFAAIRFGTSITLRYSAWLELATGVSCVGPSTLLEIGTIPRVAGQLLRGQTFGDI